MKFGAMVVSRASDYSKRLFGELEQAGYDGAWGRTSRGRESTASASARVLNPKRATDVLRKPNNSKS
jgi:hypothetical protein